VLLQVAVWILAVRQGTALTAKRRSERHFHFSRCLAPGLVAIEQQRHALRAVIAQGLNVGGA
jgi:hypothetical protein